MRRLSTYSILRRRNEREGLGINLQKVNFGDLVRIPEGALDDEVLFRRANAEEMYADCKREADGLDENELWEITNGHDICTFLGRLSKNGKANIGETGVRNILLAIYREEDFAKTKLCQNILRYQQQKHLRFLKEYVL